MSDHADIVREAITSPWTDGWREALAALDALAAERDEALRSREEMAVSMDATEATLREIRAERERLVGQIATVKTHMNGRCEHLTARAEAAEAERGRLREALQALESATRILDVMLREPAAKGLMTAEDYRGYVNGAWLGVDEANVKARAALGEDA